MDQNEIGDSGRIYSPEASDYSRLGDWQTKVAVAVMFCLVGSIVIAFVL